jgi:hypothetical protein
MPKALVAVAFRPLVNDRQDDAVSPSILDGPESGIDGNPCSREAGRVGPT